MQPHSPTLVHQQAEQGLLEDWVHEFLHTDGGNVPLSDGLRLQPRFWLGPIEVPLDRVARAAGPEAEMEYREHEADWERRVSAMVEGIRAGWQPAPFIAQYTAEGHLSLRDGNHRHEAVRRYGFHSYWCVIWCDSEPLRQEVKARYPR